MQAAQRLWVAQHGRTTVGVSGLAIGECACYVADWLRGEAPPSLREGFSAPLMLRFAVDDVKPGPPTRAAETDRRQLYGAGGAGPRKAERADTETVKVLAFDTGGTILDWHGGLVAVLAECGLRHGVEHDWHAFANEHWRRSLQRMLGAFEPSFNIDYVHSEVLDALLDEDRGVVFSAEERRIIAGRWRELDAWPDFVPGVRRLRRRYACISFTILTLPLVTTSRTAS